MQVAGLAHVAAISFLAARVAPAGAFWLSLAGGAAIARQGETRGLRLAYASSAAAMLQTVAMVGPLRFSAPLSQALSAPLLGAMHRRGRRWTSLFAVCLAIRLALYTALTAFVLFVLLGPRGFKGSYDAVLGWLPFLPHGLRGALLLAGLGNLVSAVFYSVVQVTVYQRALRGWATAAPGDAPRPPALPPASLERSGVDARVALVAAAVVTALLLISHQWVVLAAAAAWLLAAAPFARHGDREVLKIGLVLTGMLAVGTLLASLVGGLAVEDAASRGVRAGLLVLVATWLRLAAGSGGLREAFRRGLLALRRLPAAKDAAEILGDLDSARLLAGAAAALRERLRGVRRRPVDVADAVLAWAAQEARTPPVHEAAPAFSLRLRLRDATLALSVLLPTGVAAVVLGG